MSKKYRIRHETSYQYAADVVHSHHLLHLVPRPAPYQECLEHEIEIVPEANRRVNEFDAFGNPMLRVELATPHRELNVVSSMEIEVHHAAGGAGVDHRELGESPRPLSHITARGRRAISSTPRASATSRRTCD